MRLFLRSIYHCCSLLHVSSSPATIARPTSSHFKMANFFFSSSATSAVRRRKEKVVVIMGPTGSGKSRLSVELATRFSGEIINSDKIQVFKGLDITTNKIPPEERFGVPHHLLGEVDSSAGEFTPAEYRSRASAVISGIVSRRRVPMIVGGSNSFIYALLSEKYDPETDVFGPEPDRVVPELRYDCCFLWIDLSIPVLNEYLGKRVDDMLDSGMLDELTEFYESGEIDEWRPDAGVRKAIGVPEFERYFRERAKGSDDRVQQGAYREAVRAIKENTRRLAKRQIEKIQRLRMGGWGLKRLDASDSFRAVLEGSKSWSDIWEMEVVAPSVKIVNRFLEEE